MRKGLFAAIAAAGYLCAMICVFMFQKPDPDHVIPYIELMDTGNIILVEEGEAWSRLYEIDTSGRIVRAYGPAGSVAGFETTPDGRLLLIARKSGAGTTQITVSRMDDRWTGEKIIGSMVYGNQLSVSSSSISDGRLYVSALNFVENKVTLYSCGFTEEEEKELTEEMIRDLPAGHKTVDAAYDGTYLYILQNDGRLGYFTKDSYRYFPAAVEGRVMWMEASSGGLLYTTVEEDAVWFMENGESRKLCGMPVSGLLDGDCLGGGGQAAALVRDKGYDHTLVRCDSGESIACKDLAWGWKILWSVSWRVAAAVSILYISAALFLFFFLYRKKKYRPVIRTMIMSMIVMHALFIILLTVCIYRRSRGYLEESRAVSNKVFSAMEEDALEQGAGISLSHVSGLDFYDTEWADGTDETMLGLLVEDNGRVIDFTSELVYMDGDGGCVLNSGGCVTGRSLYAHYDRELAALLEEAREKGTFRDGICDVQGQPFQIYIAPAGGKNLFYIGKATLSDLDERSHQVWGNSLKWACIYGVIFTVLNLLILYHYMRPVKVAAYYMNRVAGGIYELPEKYFPDNEFGGIWVALHRMCKALRQQEYARNNVIKYYSRFAPKSFETLFGRDALQQVAAGDFVTVEGTAGIVSVVRKENLLQNGAAGEYIRYINSLLECVGRCGGKEGGVLLTNGNTLESVKVIYKEPEMTADQAVAFGVECVRRLKEWRDSRYEMFPLVLLHSGSCTCGLTGTAAQTCPFVISQELELLSEYQNLLQEIGVHVAITGQTLERLEKEHAARYIGFVTPGMGRRFALYEVLEACERAEREKKKELAEDFQHAVERYEQGYFKEAGETFLRIVKACPADLTARWYLFACEEKNGAGISAEGKEYGLEIRE